MRDRGWNTGRTSTDVVRKHRPDYLIALYTGILMLLGLVIMYAIGPQRANVLNNALGSDFSDSYFFIKQVVSIVVASIAFVVMAMLPYKFVLAHATKLLVLGFVACLILAVSAFLNLPFAQPVNGAVSWFNLGILGSFQPAEILKFGILAYLAVFLGVRVAEGTINDVKRTIIPASIVASAALFVIIVLQRDLGTGISLTAIVLTMLFVAGINKRIGLILLAVATAAALVFIAIAPHRVSRIATFFEGDSAANVDGQGYHIQNAKIAIGTGGLFGVGIGNSVQATGYLPEAINDSIFAIMGELFGFVGLVTLIALFVALLMRLLNVMDGLIDMRLKLLAAGVFGWFGAHVMLNIAAMLGIFPLTGITLPLVSAGGTSMLFIAAALGMVFHLSQYTIHPSRIKEMTQHEDPRSRGRVGRTRHAGRRSS